MNTDYLLIFMAITSLLGIFLLLLSAMPQAALELGRQQMFELRDELFDYYHENPESMTRKQYEAIRRHFHDVIRGMEYLTFWHVIIESFRKNKTTFSPEELIDKSMPQETKDRIKSLLEREVQIIFATLIYRSMLWTALFMNIFILFVFTFGLYLAIVKGIDKLMQNIRQVMREIKKDTLSAVLHTY